MPTFGVILLDSSMQQTVMMQSYGGKSWSWPKGKMNQGEEPMACAIRETFEEVGYDCSAHVVSARLPVRSARPAAHPHPRAAAARQ